MRGGDRIFCTELTAKEEGSGKKEGKEGEKGKANQASQAKGAAFFLLLCVLVADARTGKAALEEGSCSQKRRKLKAALAFTRERARQQRDWGGW